MIVLSLKIPTTSKAQIFVLECFWTVMWKQCIQSVPAIFVSIYTQNFGNLQSKRKETANKASFSISLFRISSNFRDKVDVSDLDFMCPEGTRCSTNKAIVHFQSGVVWACGKCDDLFLLENQMLSISQVADLTRILLGVLLKWKADLCLTGLHICSHDNKRWTLIPVIGLQ